MRETWICRKPDVKWRWRHHEARRQLLLIDWTSEKRQQSWRCHSIFRVSRLDQWMLEATNRDITSAQRMRTHMHGSGRASAVERWRFIGALRSGTVKSSNRSKVLRVIDVIGVDVGDFRTVWRLGLSSQRLTLPDPIVSFVAWWHAAIACEVCKSSGGYGGLVTAPEQRAA